MSLFLRIIESIAVRASVGFAVTAAIFASCMIPVAASGNETKSRIPGMPPSVSKFLQSRCYDCHLGSDAEGGLDLSQFAEPGGQVDPKRDEVETWVRMIDRVATGEMPPPDAQTLPQNEIDGFGRVAGGRIKAYQKGQAEKIGRVQGRRLTNLQLENTLQDLLGIDIPLAKAFSDEPRTGGFNNVADGQAMSLFQLEQHLGAVDAALAEAFRRATSKPDEFEVVFEPEKIVRKNPKARTREPEMREGLAVVWSSRMEFYGRLPVTTAKQPGWYRFEITASAIKKPKDHGVWCMIRSGRCVSSAPMLASVGMFEAMDQPNTWTVEAWLEPGEMLELRPRDSEIPAAKFAGGQVGAGEGDPQNVPGVAIHKIRMQRFHRGPSKEQIRNILFGDLKVNGIERKGKQENAPEWGIELVSKDPKADAAQRMLAMASHAFRRPVPLAEVQSYVDEVHGELDRGVSLVTALRNGYRALLCSPRFLYFQESPGQLDDFAIASRLSYLICQSMPDDELLTLAEQNKLRDFTNLRAQVRRLLTTARGQQFVRHFADQWLDLRDIEFTEPDAKLYREFDLVVQQSMLAETRLFLQRMLDENRSVRELIDSRETFLNSRLARYYEIDGVDGDDVRLVTLTPKSRRGGIITQGAILKVTANGTATSPVTRGVWLAERVLGEHIPPPPQNVPAIEPDIRGAKSIREILEKHRSDSACASCHAKIDPPGFALENYDPAGKWRENYGKVNRNAKPLKINAAYQLSDGRQFDDIDDFRKLILDQPENVAKCVAEKMVTFATGAAPCYADREWVSKIVAASRSSDYGFRTLLELVVCSELFLNK